MLQSGHYHFPFLSLINIMECRGEIHAIPAAQCFDTNMDIMKIVKMRDT